MSPISPIPDLPRTFLFKGISGEIITLFGEDHSALQAVAVARQASLFFRRGAAELFHQIFEKFILDLTQRNDAAILGVVVDREEEGAAIARAHDAGQGRHAAVGAGQRRASSCFSRRRSWR